MARHEHAGRSSGGFLDLDGVLGGVGLVGGERVLDAGCGGGFWSLVFSHAVGDEGLVFSVDVKDASIKSLMGKVIEGGVLNVKPVIASVAGEIPVRDGVFDVVFLSNVFHGFDGHDTEVFLDEAERVLRAGGRLAVVEFVKEQTPVGPPLDIRLDAGELEDIVSVGRIFSEENTVSVGEFSYLSVFRR